MTGHASTIKGYRLKDGRLATDDPKDSDKLHTAIKALMDCGWSEQDARRLINDCLRDLTAKGSA